VVGHEQNPGAGQQLERVGSLQFGADGERAQQGDIGQRVGGIQHLHPARHTQLVGRMDQGVPPVTVERLAIAGSGINAGGARNVSGLGIFQHEQESRRIVFGADFAGKGSQGLLDLVGQGIALFGQS
jgi:hypothetical protein